MKSTDAWYFPKVLGVSQQAVQNRTEISTTTDENGLELVTPEDWKRC